MFKKILVAVDVNQDGSWKHALPAAAGIAHEFGAELHAVSVVPDFSMPIVSQYFPANFEEKALQETKKELQAICAKHIQGKIPVECHVTLGRIYEQIVAQAKKIGADLIVVGAHNADLEDYLIGSNASKIVRHSTQSVLVVRE